VKRILVTGASGFIGRHAVEALRARGAEVVAASSRDADLLQVDASAQLLADVQPSHVLHLAWYAEPGAYWTSTENLRWLEASLRLLRAFEGERFVVAGTSAEYDWTGDGRLVEGITPERPATLYGASKLAMSRVGERVGAFSFASARIFFLYGPGENAERLVPQVALPLLNGERAAVSEGTQVRDFMHVADAGAALAALVDSNVEGPVNVASGIALPVRDVVAMVAEAVGRPDLVDYGALPQRPGDPHALVPDVSRLREEVGFEPSWSPREGLADAVAWWRDDRSG
jgi:nucleoside-diphosphate-sugar epimerase